MAQLLSRKGVPFEWQQDKKSSFDPNHDSVKIVTMHSSKGLEFPVVCIPGVGSTGSHAESAEEEARLLYVAMTRATHELVMTHGDGAVMAEKMERAMGALDSI